VRRPLGEQPAQRCRRSESTDDDAGRSVAGLADAGPGGASDYVFEVAAVEVAPGHGGGQRRHLVFALSEHRHGFIAFLR
jgi:hypothetical protein